MKKKNLLCGLVGAMCLSVGLGVVTSNAVWANAADANTASAKTVKESNLTKLSNWADVASTAIVNEANRVDGSAVVNSSFQMMWDANALYLLVKTDDATVDNADQIEFAYHNGSSNGYFLASLESAWTNPIGDLMTSSVLAQFDDTEGNRYILTKHIMVDTSVLAADNALVYNVKYSDFSGANTDSKLCDYSVTTSFGPGASITLVGTPIEEPVVLPNTAAAKTVKESKLTDLSNWEYVASKSMTNEFGREIDTVSTVSFQMMWDASALYVLVKTNDATLDTWDQIEFAYTNGSANGYFQASMLIDNGTRWTNPIGDLMTSSAIANFDDTEGNRYLLTKHVLADNTVLTANNNVVVNVVYWDFNGSHASVCKYSASSAAAPTETLTLVGTPMAVEPVVLPNTASAKTVKESKLTDLSNWEYVASTAMTNEFQRASGYDVKINASFQMMWDNNALYVLVKTDDATVDDADQIEFAYNNGTANGYFLASLESAWTSDFNDKSIMNSTVLAQFDDTEGNRYILTKHIMADTSVLDTDKTVTVNVMYKDFSVESSQLCIYSASAAAAPTETLTLVGTPMAVEPVVLPNTVAAKTVKEANLTDLSNWEYVASTAMTNEFQRASGYDVKINVSFQMMWDNNALYVLLKTDDASVHGNDQREFAYTDGSANSYSQFGFSGWTDASTTGSVAAMTSTALAKFSDAEGNRYLLSKHVMTDKSVLGANKQIVINVVYRDFDENGSQVCIYSASASASPTETLTLVGEPVNECADISFVSLSLDGNIGLNFYTDFAKTDVASVSYAIGEQAAVEIAADAWTEKTLNDVTYLVFSCPVPAKNYKDVVTLYITLANGIVEVGDFSVKAYADYVIANQASYEKDYPLVNAMVNYCEQARIYFANEAVSADFSAEYDQNTFANYQSSEEGTLADGITITQTSLVLESETTVKIYVTSTVALEVTGGTVEDLGDNNYCIRIENISAKDLDKTFAVVINGTFTLNYSAFSYAYSTYGLSDALALTNVMEAMYAYNSAANTYFAA